MINKEINKNSFLKKIYKTFILSIMMVASILVFTGCKDKDVVDTKDEKDIKVAGGTINVAMNRYQTLNPLLNKNKDVDEVLLLIYEPLMKIEKDFKTVNVLAKEVKVDDTSTSIDVELKDNVKFHDGSTLTSYDVVFSLDVLKRADDDVCYKNVLGNIATYKALDEKTVRIYLRQVYSNPTYCLCFPIISKAYYTNNNNDQVNGTSGTGRFKLTDVSLNQELKLEKFKSYHGKKPYIDGIKVVLMPNEKTSLTAFKQKQIDVMFTKDMIAGQYTGNDSVKMMPYSTLYYDFIGFNFNNEKLKNAELRRVIAHSINKKKIIEKVYYGYGKIADTMIHPNSYLYSKSATAYEYDLALAKGLLAKIENANNLNFRLLVNKENNERCEIAKMIAYTLEEVGIHITIDYEDYDKYVEKITAKDFDIVLAGWHLMPNQDISFAFSSASIYEGQNYISYADEAMDKALLDAYGQIGDTKVLEGFEKLQEFLGRELPYISIAFRENVGYLNKNKIGGTLSPLEYDNFNGIENIYVKKSAQKTQKEVKKVEKEKTKKAN